MNSDQLDEVWAMLDRAHLERVARQGPPPVFATISGAHLYGFASPDSDVDLRGAFLLPAREMLGLHPPKETITIADNSTIELDWVAHDIRKFSRMMTSHNGYVLEQLFSPLVVLGTPAFEELRELGKGCVTRPTVRHYLGFAHGRRKRLREPEPTVKHLLYAYRVYLSGIHLMRTGHVVANITVLNELFRLSEVDELVQRKREGAEKMRLADTEVALHEQHFDRLEADLNAAHNNSKLPDEPTTTAALNDFVVRLSQGVSEASLGYALAQLKRIRTHRAWLLTPPTKKPTRADFGLPDRGTLSKDDQHRLEQGIAEKVRSYGLDNVEMAKPARIAVEDRLQRFWVDALHCPDEELEQRLRAVATHSLEIPAGVVSTLNAEKRYLSAMKQWESYETWKAERNAARAELESRHGYDTKHAMHLVRLMRMGLEIVQTGELRVRRPDAEELNAIRDGALTYDELMETATVLQAKMEDAAGSSGLPADVDYARVDRLMFGLVGDAG